MNHSKYIRNCIVFSCLLFLATACYFDNGDDLYPMARCKTEGISLKTDVQPILKNYCLTCHANNSGYLGAGISLEGYENLKSYAESGVLLSTIKHEAGAYPMPKGGGKLTDCQIGIIENWIKEGYLNN